MQDDRRDEMLNKAVEASLAIGDKVLGTDSGMGPWHVSTPKTENSAAPVTPAVSMSSEQTVPSSAGSAATDSPQKSMSSAAGPGAHKLTGKNPIKPKGPIGVDIGTSSIVIAEGKDTQSHNVHRAQFNATIPFGSLYKNVLYEHEMPYFEMSNFDYLQGYGANNIANAFHAHTWRPVPDEYSQGRDGVVLCEAILQAIIGRPSSPATPLYFTVPAPALANDNTQVFIKGSLKTFFSRFGYIGMPVEEGHAVAMSELKDNNYTGLVVTVGASFCNVTLTYLSVPVVSFSLPKAGDYIDSMVAQTTDEFQFKVKEFKENSFSLTAKPATRLERGLRIYYEDAIVSIVEGLRTALGGITPANVNCSIPVVLSGGSVKPEGFLQLFEKIMGRYRLPLAISTVRIAQDPINAAARGALILANAEEL